VDFSFTQGKLAKLFYICTNNGNKNYKTWHFQKKKKKKKFNLFYYINIKLKKVSFFSNIIYNKSILIYYTITIYIFINTKKKELL